VGVAPLQTRRFRLIELDAVDMDKPAKCGKHALTVLGRESRAVSLSRILS
jgi:hypothetical protein